MFLVWYKIMMQPWLAGVLVISHTSLTPNLGKNYYYYYCYYYTPIQATIGLGASHAQQRFYDSLPAWPILALFPPCQGQPKTLQVFSDIVIPGLGLPLLPAPSKVLKIIIFANLSSPILAACPSHLKRLYRTISEAHEVLHISKISLLGTLSMRDRLQIDLKHLI